MKFNFKKFILFFSFIFLILYIPLSFTIYSNSWYESNFKSQEITKSIGLENATIQSNNLINFFKHKEELNFIWNKKEILHMGEVRTIYDILFFIGIISIIFFSFNFEKKLIKKFSKINIFIISSLILLIPIFNYFWINIFHILMFNNNFWIINPNDISYYLFPIEFFKNSLIFIILTGILTNMILYFYFSYKKS